MNLRIQILITCLSINLSCYLFSSAKSGQMIVPGINSTTLTLGTPYSLLNLPAQDNPFTAQQVAERSFSNLWGLLSSTTSTETPRDHVLNIIRSGQLHAACALAPIQSGDTRLETTDPKFLELLTIVTGEEFTRLRTTSHENRSQALRVFEENRRKANFTITNASLLLAAIKSSAATQAILTAEKRHLFFQAISQAVKQETELVELINKEHAALIAALEQIKEKLEL